MSATKALRAPSKIASVLDWKKASGAILSMDIGSNKIGLAIASHPAFGEGPIPLDAIPIQLETRDNRRVLTSEVTRQIEDIVKSYNVSSFVVSWPVQREGRCGHACGKTLHLLDNLVANSNVMNDRRPFCLWDEHHYAPQEDAWGRNPVYGEPCKEEGKTVHKASEEQYSHEVSSTVAAKVMDNFMRSQWPEIYASAAQQQAQQGDLFAAAPVTDYEDVSVEWLDNYEDTEAYMTVAV